MLLLSHIIKLSKAAMLHAAVPRLANSFFFIAGFAWIAAFFRLVMLNDWTGAVICCVGLLGAVMIVSSLHSRSRRSMYSDRNTSN
jgi:hypothetical protein